MNMYALRTKTVPELREICKTKNLKAKTKQDMIDILTKHACFHRISTYEDDELVSLRVFFNLFRKHAHEGGEGASEEEGIIPESAETTDPIPSGDAQHQFIDTLRSECSCGSELTYTEKVDPRKSHIYEYHKEGILSRYGDLGNSGEMILIHGTDESNIKEILDDDFSFTINTSHGKMCGKGIYFTQDLALACKYSERRKLKKYFIVCLVHVGDVVKGHPGMDKLPRMDSGDKYYDTSVDCVDYPKQFVKYRPGTYNILGVLKLDIINTESPLFRRDRGITMGGNGLTTGRRNWPTVITPSPSPSPSIPDIDMTRIKEQIEIHTREMRVYDKSIQGLLNSGRSRAAQEAAGTSEKLLSLHVGKDKLMKHLERLNKELSQLVRDRSYLNRSTNKCQLKIYNEIQNPLEVYYSKKTKPEGFVISNQLRVKIPMPHICPNLSDIWASVQKYCFENNLFYQNCHTGIFLPDQMLMDLLTISPTTRISSQNIRTLLKDRITLLTDDNLGLILDTATGYKLMTTIEPSASWAVNASIGHTFICGFRTMKRKYPENFVLMKKITVSLNYEKYIIP
jgi:hypothetical protein